MIAIARNVALALCLSTVAATSAHAAGDDTLSQLKRAMSSRFDGQASQLVDYVAVTVDGMPGKAFALKDSVSRSDLNQPSVLVFDKAFQVVAVGYARPSAGKVTLLSLVDASITEAAVTSSVAAR